MHSDYNLLTYYGFNPKNTQHNSFEVIVPLAQLIPKLQLANLSKYHMHLLHQAFPEAIKVMHAKYELFPNYSFQVQIKEGKSCLRWHDVTFLQALCLQTLDLERSQANYTSIMEDRNTVAFEEVQKKKDIVKRVLFMEYIEFIERKSEIEREFPDVHSLLMSEIQWIREMEIQL